MGHQGHYQTRQIVYWRKPWQSVFSLSYSYAIHVSVIPACIFFNVKYPRKRQVIFCAIARLTIHYNSVFGKVTVLQPSTTNCILKVVETPPPRPAQKQNKNKNWNNNPSLPDVSSSQRLEALRPIGVAAPFTCVLWLRYLWDSYNFKITWNKSPISAKVTSCITV